MVLGAATARLAAEQSGHGNSGEAFRITPLGEAITAGTALMYLASSIYGFIGVGGCRKAKRAAHVPLI